MHPPLEPEGPVAVLRLPSRLDITAAASLRQWLLDLDSDGTLNAASVEVVTTPALQVLMAGRDHLRAAGHCLSIATPSPAFLSCISTLGAGLDRLTHQPPKGAA